MKGIIMGKESYNFLAIPNLQFELHMAYQVRFAVLRTLQ